NHSAELTSGVVNPMTHLMENNKATRMTKANMSPIRRARFCCSKGNLPLWIEIKTMLSIPKTISKTVNVKKEIHICGSSNHSIRKIKKLNTCFLLKDQTFYRGSSGLGSIRYQRNNIFIKLYQTLLCMQKIQTDQKSETDHLCSSLLHQSGSRRDRASGCQ